MIARRPTTNLRSGPSARPSSTVGMKLVVAANQADELLAALR
ncbi:hypothetical protein [Kibdelosporangium philippinense]